jgi:hypothetical protein
MSQKVIVLLRIGKDRQDSFSVSEHFHPVRGTLIACHGFGTTALREENRCMAFRNKVLRKINVPRAYYSEVLRRVFRQEKGQHGCLKPAGKTVFCDEFPYSISHDIFIW